MMNRIGSKLLVVAAASLVTVGIVVGISAAASRTPYTFYACITKGGNVTHVSTWSGTTCSDDQSLVTWNSVGPQGRPGDKGAPGAPGAQGPQGPQGPAGTPAVNPNVLYNSLMLDSSYQFSQAYVAATGINDLGNAVTLADGGGTLKSAVVSFANWNPSSDYTAPTSATLTIYNWDPNQFPDLGSPVTPGSEIATKTISFTPPSSGSNCTFNFAGCPDNFTETFTFGSGVTVPANIVYGISYNSSLPNTDSGLNLNLALESSSVPSAGADTFPGWLFVSTQDGNNDSAGGTGSPNSYGGQVTCQNVSSTFAQYSTASTANSGWCGLADGVAEYGSPATPAQPPIDGNLVPAVEFLSN